MGGLRIFEGVGGAYRSTYGCNVGWELELVTCEGSLGSA